MFDGPNDKHFIAVVEKFWTEAKIVASVCHGPAGLVAIRAPDGIPIVKGKKVGIYLRVILPKKQMILFQCEGVSIMCYVRVSRSVGFQMLRKQQLERRTRSPSFLKTSSKN